MEVTLQNLNASDIIRTSANATVNSVGCDGLKSSGG